MRSETAPRRHRGQRRRPSPRPGRPGRRSPAHGLTPEPGGHAAWQPRPSGLHGRRYRADRAEARRLVGVVRVPGVGHAPSPIRTVPRGSGGDPATHSAASGSTRSRRLPGSAGMPVLARSPAGQAQQQAAGQPAPTRTAGSRTPRRSGRLGGAAQAAPRPPARSTSRVAPRRGAGAASYSSGLLVVVVILIEAGPVVVVGSDVLVVAAHGLPPPGRVEAPGRPGLRSRSGSPGR